MITDEELAEIFSNAPVEKDWFEVVKIYASWFSKPYYLQNTFTEGIDVSLEDDSVVTAEYAPMAIGESSSNADMSYERNITVQSLNDMIAIETDKRPVGTNEKIKLEFYTYAIYRDGSISGVKGNVPSVQLIKTARDDKGTTLSTSSKPVSKTRTGEVVTLKRVPMIRGFM